MLHKKLFSRKLFTFCNCHLITSVIKFIICMALNFIEFNFVNLCKRIKFLPKFLIFYRTSTCSFPTFFHPAINPILQKCVAEIGAVSIDVHLAGLLQRAHRLDVGPAFCYFAHSLAKAQNRR